ncbi:MAG TPA: hypothetical protein VGR73_06510 [Bryobacteraceae bacterium]|nr:hypothetical protein [Bryobacteraceae bacterium]
MSASTERYSFVLLVRTALGVLLSSSSLPAQRVFEKGEDVIYEDSQGKQINLGHGYSPVLTSQGKIALIRGPRADYVGSDADCIHSPTKNWVAVYDPAAHSEKILFDRSVVFFDSEFCVFEQMQLSPDGKILYLVSPVSPTSGSLALVRLSENRITFVHGVNEVHVIENGPHRGELIYQRRLWQKDPHDGNAYPHYPFVHARADGTQIRVLADEYFTVGGGTDHLPRLKAYLQQIGGQIRVNGELFP